MVHLRSLALFESEPALCHEHGEGKTLNSLASPNPSICCVAGNLKAGMALYEKALAHNPRHADALYNMGVACAESGDIHRAIYCYELAVHFNPLCAEAHNNLGGSTCPCAHGTHMLTENHVY